MPAFPVSHQFLLSHVFVLFNSISELVALFPSLIFSSVSAIISEPQMLNDELVMFRMGGLIRNCIWTVVVAACPNPGPTTSPAGHAAARVVASINGTQVTSLFFFSLSCSF
jgi:hypothetical protein